MRRLAVIVLAACHSGGPTTPTPTPNPAPGPALEHQGDAAPVPVATETSPQPFPRDSLTSHFAAGPRAQVLALYRRQDYEPAIQAARTLLGAAEGDAKQQIQILLAVIERDAGKFADAAPRFAQAASTHALLADYLHYEAARAFGRTGDATEAAKHASLVAASSPWASDMAFLLAESARAAGDFSKAVALYRDYLDQGDDETLLEEARFHLGEALLAGGDKAAADKAWRELVVRSPVSSWVEPVRKAGAIPSDKSLSTAELMQRGMGYFAAMRNPASEADFKSAMKRDDLSADEHCIASFHRAKSAYKERAYRRSASLFEPAVRLCEKSGNQKLEVIAAYHAGRAYSRSGDHDKAVAFYALAEKYPEHSYADDARLRQAEEYLALQQGEKVTELLSTLPTMYKAGDMRGIALWRLARRAYFQSDYKAAVGWLELQIETVPIETNWWAEGQAHYWLGRSLGRLSRLDEAADAYAECIRRYPLTYYSLQAFNRLKNRWPERYETLLSEMQAAPSPWQDTLQPRALYGTLDFKRALELARLGLPDATYRQLQAIGMVVPSGRKAQEDPNSIDLLVATTMLHDLAGGYENSHWIGRWHAVDYRRAWPNGDNAKRWRLAYPLAFSELIEEFAGKHTYPMHLQMAIMREESGFDPERESWANAIGLTQMIFPTAHDHAKGTGIEVTRENLQHPVKNVTIGSHFLESLQQAFDGRVGLMVPGYNAGRARVRSWIRSRHRYDLDEFIERIKGDQARRYTKRVLGSYFVYRYLETKTVPVVRNQVPRVLGKKPKAMRKKKRTRKAGRNYK